MLSLRHTGFDPSASTTLTQSVSISNISVKITCWLFGDHNGSHLSLFDVVILVRLLPSNEQTQTSL